MAKLNWQITSKQIQSVQNIVRTYKDPPIVKKRLTHAERSRSDKATEREVADFLAYERLAGVKHKQARNILQQFGLVRLEIPIDSRILNWLKSELEISVSKNDLARSYHSVLDEIQTLCKESEVMPCVLDGAIFASVEDQKDIPWTDYEEEWGSKLTPDEFWRILVNSIMTTNTKSGQGTALDRYRQDKPFVYDWIECRKLNEGGKLFEHVLKSFEQTKPKPTRYWRKAAQFIATNLVRLENGLWEEIETRFSRLQSV
ncbi:MAG: hypothetical protein K8T89_21800 [Planctomycetes bacterium]|nr:hypothetical protein [Planctomycetota bacterium]